MSMKNPPRPVDSLPDVRDKVLQSAGLHDERLSELLSVAVETARTKLAATKVTRTTYKGEVIETHYDDDHSTQLRAAELLMNFGVAVAGLKRGGDDSKSTPARVAIQINLPGQADAHISEQT